jgi:F0F1-type ATP synthase membrane subunit a
LYFSALNLLAGEPILGLILTLFAIAMFTATAWAGWKYWKTEQDKRDLWSLLLALQIPAFNISGVGYGFYSGLTIPFGLAGGQVGIGVNLTSSFSLWWGSQSANFDFTLNLAAIIVLLLLRLDPVPKEP